MILSRRNRVCGWSSANGFTLVEILVAVAVLSIIVLVMAQIFNGTSKLVSQSNSSTGALDAGEAVLGQISLDISRMVLRDDIDYDFTKQINGDGTGDNSGDDRLSFYARTSGFTATGSSASSPRPLSIVSYQVGTNPGNGTSPQLNYGAFQVDWTSSPPAGATAFTLSALVSGTQMQYLAGGDLPLPAATNYTTLAAEVIRFEYCFVLKTDPITTDATPQLLTSTVPTGQSNGAPAIENVAGIVVGIVVVDPRSRLLFPAGADIKLARLFGDSANNQDILTLWSPKLTPATLQSVGIPIQTLSGIHIYQRYCPFPW